MEENNQEALQLAESARQMGTLLKDNNVIIWADWVICAVMAEIGPFALAEGYVHEELTLIEMPEIDYRMKAMVPYQAGVMEMNRGDFSMAAKWLKIALKQSIDLSLEYTKFFTYGCNVYVQDRLQNFEAGKMNLEAMKVSARGMLRESNPHLWSYYCACQGEHHFLSKQYALAAEAAEKALVFREKAESKILLCKCLILLGAAYREIGETGKALGYLNRAMDVNDRIQSSPLEASGRLQLALLSLRLGEQAEFEQHSNQALAIGAKESLESFYLVPDWQLQLIIENLPERVSFPGYRQKLCIKLGKTALPPSKAVQNQEAQGGRLHFHLLGPFAVEADKDRQLEACANKPLYLLKILAVVHAKISTQKIIEEMWSDWDCKLAMNNFYSVVHQLRKYLGDNDAVKSSRGFCWLEPDFFTTDLEQFEQLLGGAQACLQRKETQRAVKMFEQAIALYRGELLEGDVLGELLGAQRVSLERKYYHSVIELSRLLIQLKDFDRAITQLNQVLTNPFCDEDAFQLIMGAHYLSGNTRQAIQIYNKLKNSLLTEYGMEPHANTTQLILDIKEGRDISLERKAG